MVRRAIEGDSPGAHDAFRQLVDRWQDFLFRFVLKQVRHRQDAEDLAQETFVRAWRFRRTLREPDRFGGWLFTIAKNCIHSHRERKGNPAVKATPYDEEVLEMQAVIYPLELRVDLQQALARIPDNLRRVLHDSHESRMTYEEIASREGVHASTIRNWLREARSQLEDVLSATGYLEVFGREIEERRSRRAPAGPGAAVVSPGGTEEGAPGV